MRFRQLQLRQANHLRRGHQQLLDRRGPEQRGGSGTITVAVVQNPHMTNIAKLTPAGFTASHPNIKVKFVTLDENTLRDQVTKDVAAGGGQFDVVMIGPND
ncbi:MAG: polyol transport system substrate-binding protein, partial [Frankiales bacterium]|nr:polyol transport system substrate-binding protein [Frankiales bacterium]